LHVCTIVAATPLGLYAAHRKRSGRIRVIAVKRPDPDKALPVTVVQRDGAPPSMHG
jgi:hypothetical protein